LATEALLSEFAESFLTRLTPENLRVWWNDVYPHFLARPITGDTVDRPSAGDPVAKARIVEPFLIIFKLMDEETVAIASITWSPGSPGGDPELSRQL
jgi:hypothetical protein